MKVAMMALDTDYHHAAAVCAYAAMFWAAIAALTQVGVRRERWSHGGLWAAFRDELVRKRRVYPEKFAMWLTEAYELRSDAHYDPVIVPVKKVRRLVTHAQEFVTAVKEVIGK